MKETMKRTIALLLALVLVISGVLSGMPGGGIARAEEIEKTVADEIVVGSLGQEMTGGEDAWDVGFEIVGDDNVEIGSSFGIEEEANKTNASNEKTSGSHGNENLDNNDSTLNEDLKE